MRDDLGLLWIFFKDGQKEPRQSHGATQRIGGPSEGSSETGSDAKTQGHRSAKKPLRLRISCGFAKEFERANKARARRKPSWDEKSRYGFLFARTSIANRPRRLTSGGMLARWHIHIV